MKSVYFEHYSRVPAPVWRWMNFTPREIASKGNGAVLIHFDAMDKLQRARDLAGTPLVVHSAYRDDLYNARVGGVPRSYHLEGRAFDIGIGNIAKRELMEVLRAAGFTGFGLHYKTFVHADNGRKREW